MRTETPNRLLLNSIDGQGSAVDAPARTCARVLVVVAKVPDQIRGAVVGDAEVMCDAGDSAQRIVEVYPRGVDLADDRVFGSGQAGQCRHRRADAVATAVFEHRIERPRRVR